MAAVARVLRPHAVLFACGLNMIRSPMAAALFKHLFGSRAYVGSVGVRKGELDPFAAAVMDEVGLDISKHRPMTFEELDESEGLNFDASSRGASQGTGTYADDRGRRRVLANAGSLRGGRQPGTATRRLP